jgi:SAM-dependent methyltransferase
MKMIQKISIAWLRVRRTMAQRGVRSAIANIFRRIRIRDFPYTPLALGSTHPFDHATGLDTGGYIHGSQLRTGHPHDLYSVSYYGSAPSLVQTMLDRWLKTPPLKPIDEYTFIDLGSGKGRVVLIASKLPFRKSVGVELNPALNAVATENIKRWQAMGHSACPIQALCQEATEFQFPETPCLVYLFNPFTAKVLAKLLNQIADSFADRPGQLDLLYVNAEFKSLLEQHRGFTKLWEIPITMSPEDSAADLLHMVDQSGNKQYDELQQEPCSGWRWIGTSTA